MSNDLDEPDLIRPFERRVNQIQAARVTDVNIDALARWCGGKVMTAKDQSPAPVSQNAYLQRSNPMEPARSLYYPNVIEGILVAEIGDWIFQNEHGRFESLPNKQFMDLYEYVRPKQAAYVAEDL